MIKAVIFDMDGLLIDSEPLWGEALDKALYSVGVKGTPEDRHHILGTGLKQTVDYYYRKYGWQGVSPEKLGLRVVDDFLQLFKQKGSLCPGVHQVLELCKQHKLPKAVASSTALEVVTEVLNDLSIFDDFDLVYSGAHEPYNKPHPGVFLTVAQKLKVDPRHCLVFEDAPSGVLAAKAARMHCIAVPEPEVKSHPYIQIADVILDSLEDFKATMLQA